MNKQELIENYTMEQLADMIVKLQEESSEYERSLDGFFCITAIKPYASETALKRINRTRSFKGTRIITDETYNILQDDKNTYKELSQTMENKVKYLKDQLYHKENEISELKQKLERQEVATKYTEEYVDSLKNDIKRKETALNQIDSIICELFGIAHNGGEYTEEFKELLKEKLKGNVGSDGYCEKQKKTNNFYGMYAYSAKDLTKDDVLMFLGILTKELIENGINFGYDMENEMKVYDMTIKDRKTIADFLPEEPIKVADVLINTHNRTLYENAAYYPRMFDVSELRQIAKHLLIYCN